MPGEYQYDRIDASNQIRLLKLSLTGNQGAPIVCRLMVFDRVRRPSYETLSYTWGDRTLSRTIICAGRDLEVTQNCYDALVALREFFTGRAMKTATDVQPPLLWIDAICIDQDNTVERNAQVAVMGEIFRAATLTRIWPGIEDPFAHELMEEALRSDLDPDLLANIALNSASSETDSEPMLSDETLNSGSSSDEAGPSRNDADQQGAAIAAAESDEEKEAIRTFERIAASSVQGDITAHERAQLAYGLWSSINDSRLQSLFLSEYEDCQHDDEGLTHFADSLWRSMNARDDERKEIALRLKDLSREESIRRERRRRERQMRSVMSLSRSKVKHLEHYTKWLSPIWHRLFTKAWFTRLWVVQEVFLSQKLEMLIGSRSYDWDVVLSAGDLLSEVARFRPPPSSRKEKAPPFPGSTSPTDSSPPRDRDQRHKAQNETLTGAALLSHLELIKPLIVTKHDVQWPIQWRTPGTIVKRFEQPDNVREILFRVSREKSSGAPCAATELCKLLEASSDLKCSDRRDRVFGLLGLFQGDLPEELTIDYAKSHRNILCDLSFFLLSRGNFTPLSLACIDEGQNSPSYPSWTVDWESYDKVRRQKFDRRFQAPSCLTQHVGNLTLTSKRHRWAIALRGRILNEPIQETSELHPGSEPTLRIRLRSGLWSLATHGARAGDVLCLFAGCDRAFILRTAEKARWRLVAQSRLTCNISQNPDWREIIPDAAQSELEYIWIQ